MITDLPPVEPNFDRAIVVVLRHEGGFVDDPSDPGGATNFGITLPTWKEYFGKDGSPSDIENLTEETAKEIYKGLYWDQLHLDTIADPNIQLCLLDQAVLQGKDAAVKILQALVGVSVDGKLGPQTIAAINMRSDRKLAFQFIQSSFFHFNAIAKERPTLCKFLDGWHARLFSLFDFIFVEIPT